jgi:hypothetical protein
VRAFAAKWRLRTCESTTGYSTERRNDSIVYSKPLHAGGDEFCGQVGELIEAQVDATSASGIVPFENRSHEGQMSGHKHKVIVAQLCAASLVNLLQEGNDDRGRKLLEESSGTQSTMDLVEIQRLRAIAIVLDESVTNCVDENVHGYVLVK